MEDAEDFAAFVAVSGTHLYRMALLLTRNEAEAQDATQDALLRTARHWRRIRRSNPLAYAHRALSSVVIDAGRKRSVQEKYAPMFSTVEQPDDSQSRAVSRLDVRRYLVELPSRQRVILVMRYWADLSEAEIALALGVHEGTVKSQRSRAVATIRRRMAEAEEADHAGH